MAHVQINSIWFVANVTKLIKVNNVTYSDFHRLRYVLCASDKNWTIKIITYNIVINAWLSENAEMTADKE